MLKWSGKWGIEAQCVLGDGVLGNMKYNSLRLEIRCCCLTMKLFTT